MAVTSTTITASHRSTRSISPLVRTTVGVGLAGAGATTALAAAVHAAGVPLAIDGEQIPFAGFAQLTFVGAVLGGLLVAFLSRRRAAAHRRFLQTAVALTALSCVPSVALPPDTATKLTLVVLLLIAAAIIVPVLARQIAQ